MYCSGFFSFVISLNPSIQFCEIIDYKAVILLHNVDIKTLR